MSYRLTPQAEADLEEIADYLSQHSPAAAVKLIDRLHAKWQLLATQPRSGAPRDDLMPGLRHSVMGNQIAFYRIDGEDVEIVRVLHGRRNITEDDLSA